MNKPKTKATGPQDPNVYHGRKARRRCPHGCGKRMRGAHHYNPDAGEGKGQCRVMQARGRK